ncbi:MAG: hypothetical protein F6K63_35200 [Moorea sp. SIO1G6]|uniref:hypothetical protein n=1 Tax=Moorena sp. SIO1G6 TaxID=2607840 RepID=UPI0013C0C339|nr:hypothetical protein [Moorena sp. SIO1G6]NET69349.1 hypothetical protein [Moorena sp. SIO1G6]
MRSEGKSEVRSQKLEVRSQPSAVSGQQSAVSSQRPTLWHRLRHQCYSQAERDRVRVAHKLIADS